jgi:very-short-patch-repair endonuclease
VVALDQLQGLGLSRAVVHRRVKAGRLHPVYRGVFAVGYRRLTYKGWWLAAVLACGDGAVLSHRCALALWQLRPRPAGPVDVTVAARGLRPLEGIRRHCVRALDARDVRVRDAIPVTSVARTLLDCAEVLEPEQLRLALEAAERCEVLDTRAIEALLARSPGRPGVPRLRAALSTWSGSAPWTQSELERRFLAFARATGLPEPECNVLIAGELVDACWRARRVIVEVDSWGFHRTRAQFEKDRRRDALLQSLGWRVVRVTQRRLEHDATKLAAQLRALLEL